MSFAALEKEVNRIAFETSGDISVFIETKDGNIDVDGSEKVPAASVIKVPIMLEGLRQQEKRQFDLGRKIMIQQNDIVGGGGVIRRLSENVQLTYRDLMELMIIVSDNTASNILAETLGFYSINSMCRQMGCQHTDLQRRFMAARDEKDNYTSAVDMVTILKEIIDGDMLTPESKHIAFTIMSEQKFKGLLPGYREKQHEAITFAHKTGSLTGIRNDVAIIQYKEQTVYVAVLTRHLSSMSAGQHAISSIGRSIMDYLVREQY